MDSLADLELMKMAKADSSDGGMIGEGSKPNIAIQLNIINRLTAEDQQITTSSHIPAPGNEKSLRVSKQTPAFLLGNFSATVVNPNSKS